MRVQVHRHVRRSRQLFKPLLSTLHNGFDPWSPLDGATSRNISMSMLAMPPPNSAAVQVLFCPPIALMKTAPPPAKTMLGKTRLTNYQ